MSIAAELAERLLTQASASEDTAKTQELVSLARTLTEAEKLDLEAHKLKLEAANLRRLARADNWRFALSVLAPSLSALAVVLALGVQVYQVNKNAVLQRESNEATNLREALKLVTSREQSKAHAGAVLLSSMFRSPGYASTARAMAMAVLSHSVDPPSFEALLRDFMLATDWKNFQDVVFLSRTLSESLGFQRTRQNKLKTGQEKLRPGEIHPDLLVRALNDETRMVAGHILTFIRTRKRPSSQALDLSGANLSSQDLSGLNISGAIITDATFEDAKMKGLDLSDIIEFTDSNWTDSEWWHAKRISKELVRFLETEYQCRATRARDCSAYAFELARLKAQLLVP